MTAGATPRFRLREVICVGVDFQDRVAGLVGDNGVGVGGGIVQKLFHLLHYVFSGGGLLRGKGAECGKNVHVDSAGIL